MSPTQVTIEPRFAPPVPPAEMVSPINALPPPAKGGDQTEADTPSSEAQTGVPPVGGTEVPSVLPPQAIPIPPLSLEQRVRRLEDALGLLQEQQGTAKERNVAPSTESRPSDPPPEAASAPLSAAPASPASTGILLDVGKRLLGTAVAVPVAAPPAERRGVWWLLWDTWAEARTIVRMFVDPRYHLPWSARVLPLILLAAILTSKYWVPGSSIPLLGDWLLVKLVDLLLAFLLFKWLGHEARRYRQTSPDLPPSLRL